MLLARLLVCAVCRLPCLKEVQLCAPWGCRCGVKHTQLWQAVHSRLQYLHAATQLLLRRRNRCCPRLQRRQLPMARKGWRATLPPLDRLTLLAKLWLVLLLPLVPLLQQSTQQPRAVAVPVAAQELLLRMCTQVQRTAQRLPRPRLQPARRLISRSCATCRRGRGAQPPPGTSPLSTAGSASGLRLTRWVNPVNSRHSGA